MQCPRIILFQKATNISDCDIVVSSIETKLTTAWQMLRLCAILIRRIHRSQESRNSSMSTPRTVAEKVWADHTVGEGEKQGDVQTPHLLYIDLHMVHEVTSPQAFEGLRLAGRPVRRPDLTIGVEDHNVPTMNINEMIAEPTSRKQVDALRDNAEEF